ncbi:hypothetical protein J4Q44_G00131250 [Coregonus suidteri]|uniref:Uncharacterized protein n=1 Tax=Coregonus suidteri TaxID=861788 RepID=A0AAN8MAL7_9TELE
MKEILSELKGVSHGFAPTKVPNVKYELSESLSLLRTDAAASAQELQEMLERHRVQNETWLRAQAEENDKERKELCKLRVFSEEGEGKVFGCRIGDAIKRRQGRKRETKISFISCYNFTIKRVFAETCRDCHP